MVLTMVPKWCEMDFATIHSMIATVGNRSNRSPSLSEPLLRTIQAPEAFWKAAASLPCSVQGMFAYF